MTDMDTDRTRPSAPIYVLGVILVACGVVPLLAVGLLDMAWQDRILMTGGTLLLITGCVILGRQSVRR
jgi:high-affinity Fe2+/Pb2+ permease